jgi:alpha-L-fucosidase
MHLNKQCWGEQSMRRRELLKLMGTAPFAFVPPPHYESNWGSIDSRPTPRWWSDAKFGVLLVWGVYSVPAYAPVHAAGETPYSGWYWHSLVEGKKASSPSEDGFLTWAFHKRVYGADFSYFDFASMFRAELFDPGEWMDLCVRSGARYVVQATKHHDGFALWQSEDANRSWGRLWNSVDIGPKRDLVMEIRQEGTRRGLRMGIYYSLFEWFNPLWLSDRKRYVTDHMFPQFKDIVEHAEPSIIFADGEWDLTSEEWRSPDLLAWLFNDSPVRNDVVINDRWGKDTRHRHGGYYTTEYTAGIESATHPWEESRGIGYSYPYNRMELCDDYHTGRQLILMLIDLVSRGGNFLLAIGPSADGRIPVIMQERLIEIGNWLKLNGEAIYGTHELPSSRQWSAGIVPTIDQKVFGVPYNITQLVDTPPPGHARIDAFFTAKDDCVYALLPRRPEKTVRLNGFVAPASARITLLESDDALPFRVGGNGIDIDVSSDIRLRLPNRETYVLKMRGVKPSPSSVSGGSGS